MTTLQMAIPVPRFGIPPSRETVSCQLLNNERRRRAMREKRGRRVEQQCPVSIRAQIMANNSSSPAEGRSA